MKMKEQNDQNGKNLEEMKQPVGGELSDEALDQVSGGMRIQMDDETAATKNYRSEH